jgi:hypothetical protein
MRAKSGATKQDILDAVKLLLQNEEALDLIIASRTDLSRHSNSISERNLRVVARTERRRRVRAEEKVKDLEKELQKYKREVCKL